MYRIYFIHPRIKGLERTIEYLHIGSLPLAKELVWDDEHPEYIFVSEHIYLNWYCYSKFKKADKSAVLIYVAGECIAPDLNVFDYAVTFDNKLSDHDRVFRMPTMLYFSKSIINDYNQMTESMVQQELERKTKFCCFIYSNGKAHPMRDRIFYVLSDYKRVESLGRHLKNTILGIELCSNDWRSRSITLKSMYKFSIAAENASYCGYTSEKLLTSFQSHSVPIYWGNPDIAEEFNPEAFINVSDFNSYEEFISRIREVDEDDELWKKIVCAPWQTESQIRKQKEQESTYYQFMEHIFYQKYSEAKRVPAGTYPTQYEYFFSRGFGFIYSFSRMRSRIREMVIAQIHKMS